MGTPLLIEAESNCCVDKQFVFYHANNCKTNCLHTAKAIPIKFGKEFFVVYCVKASNTLIISKNIVKALLLLLLKYSQTKLLKKVTRKAGRM